MHDPWLLLLLSCFSFFSFLLVHAPYDFWLWLCGFYFFFFNTGFTKKNGFIIHTLLPQPNPFCPLHVSFVCFSVLLTTIPNYTPPLLPITSFFILSTVSTLLSAFFLQLPHDNFNLSKYARELLFFFFLSSLFLFFFLSSCLLS